MVIVGWYLSWIYDLLLLLLVDNRSRLVTLIAMMSSLWLHWLILLALLNNRVTDRDITARNLVDRLGKDLVQRVRDLWLIRLTNYLLHLRSASIRTVITSRLVIITLIRAVWTEKVRLIIIVDV